MLASWQTYSVGKFRVDDELSNGSDGWKSVGLMIRLK